MDEKTVLVIEDEEDIQQLVAFNLMKEGFRVRCADSGEEGLRQADSLLPDMVLLDIMLPGIDGLAVLRQLKTKPKLARIPVIMLSAKGEEQDIVSGLNLGADDYVPKPFSPKVLLARIRSVLRRQSDAELKEQPSPQVLSVHGLTIDFSRRQVMADERAITLTVSEFEILTLLARHPGWVYTRQQIIDQIRGQDYTVTERLVDVQVFGLRKKMGSTGELIETVRGIGYRFKE
ncbi:MAG: response regulator transcription factor [Deltaproteobacteria bacterium]